MSRVEMAMRQRVQEVSGEAFTGLPETEFYALVKKFEALSGNVSRDKNFRVVTVRQTSVEIQTDSLPCLSAPQARILPFQEGGGVSPQVARYTPETPQPRIADAKPVLDKEILPRHAELLTEPVLPDSTLEELRQLRTTILFAARNHGLKTVMICGTSRQESAQADFIATQLSVMLADCGHLKVAFLRVTDQEQPPERNHLTTQTNFTFVLRRTNRVNLYEVASSRGTVTLQDWVHNYEPEQVVQFLRQKFDLLVLVTPPVTLRHDATLLAGAVDGVILTATESETSYARIERAQQRLAQARATILGVTLLHSLDSRPLLTRLRQLAERWLERDKNQLE